PAVVESPLPALDPPAPKPSGAAALPAQPATEIPLDDSFATAAPPVENKAQPPSGLALQEKPARAAEPPPKTDPVRRPVTKPQPAKPKEPEIAPAKAVVSSAVTGLLGAALAIIVVIASALSDE